MQTIVFISALGLPGSILAREATAHADGSVTFKRAPRGRKLERIIKSHDPVGPVVLEGDHTDAIESITWVPTEGGKRSRFHGHDKRYGDLLASYLFNVAARVAS